jgi:DUF1365 family protein
MARLTNAQRKQIIDAARNWRSILTLAIGFPFLVGAARLGWYALTLVHLSLCGILGPLVGLAVALLIAWVGVKIISKGLEFAVMPAIEAYRRVTQSTPHRR